MDASEDHLIYKRGITKIEAEEIIDIFHPDLVMTDEECWGLIIQNI